MSERDFLHFSRYIHEKVGIKLPPSKKTMVEARLQKRLRLLGIATHKEYLEYLFSRDGLQNEMTSLINVVTTNTTDFFREPQHFKLLTDSILPRWFDRNGRSRTLRVWSAGCSIGMEPYTLAMVLSEFSESTGLLFSITGTDISTQALEKAARAIYEEERVEPVPMYLRRKYMLRSKDKRKGLVRMAPEIRRLIDFRHLNFMEDFHFDQPMDIIFCRNVVIYFDRPTQEILFSKFCRSMRPGSHLFVGHSESLSGMELPLESIAPTVYRRS